jgi:hypothetical protein
MESPHISCTIHRGDSCPKSKYKAGAMLPELLQKANLFYLLHLIDIELAKQQRQGRCLHCGGPLHQANYQRQGWGAPGGIPDEYLSRQSLCCGWEGCRRRILPPSCIYMGRWVYWAGIILVVMALRQRRPDGWSARQLMERFGISRKTLLRWGAYFRDVFPPSAQWQCLRGRISSTVRDSELPGRLLEYFLQQAESVEKGFIECLHFLARGSADFF